MQKTRISRRLKERIAEAAQHRCGYCHTREAISGIPLTIEHIIPESGGGTSEEENLWLACRPCNVERAARPLSNEPVRSDRTSTARSYYERKFVSVIR